MSERAILSKRKYQGDEYYDIFYSERLDLTPALSSWEEMDNFYNARKAFHDELYHPLNLTQFKLKEGEMVVFDNRYAILLFMSINLTNDNSGGFCMEERFMTRIRRLRKN